MKRIISKILIILILFVMLFEFTCSSPISYAVDIRTDPESWVNRITSLMGGIISIKLWLFRLQATGIIVTTLDLATNTLAESCGISSDPFFDGTKAKPMTPIDIFYNKYAILDINFFEIEDKNWIEAAFTDDIIGNLRKGVATWYYTFRNISAIILLCILIYVGIRMALATVADEKAKYQKMLYDWLCSFILIFVLQYIIIFTIEANNGIVHFLREALMVRTGILQFTSMDAILGLMALQATTGMGMGSFIAIAALCMIVFQTIAFFLAYLNRMLKVAFLILISPLISVTYSIDKIGDGKAQALNSWLKEFVYTILIQPFHIVLYMAFANTAMALLTTTNPWLGFIDNIISGGYSEIVNAVLVILCLKFVNDGEKIIRKIFNFQDDSSTTSMAAGAAVGLAALNTMKKGAQIGSKAAGVVNKFGAMPARLSKALAASEKLKDAKAKFDNTSVGKYLKSDHFKKVKQSKILTGGTAAIGKGAKFLGGIGKGAYNRINKAITGVRKLKNNSKFYAKHKDKLKKLKEANKRYLPKTMALMGAAMSYATGTSGAMQAIGMGNAFMQGTEGYFSSSGGFLAAEAGEQLMDQLKDDDEEYQENARQIAENEKALDDNSAALKQADGRINSIAKATLNPPESIAEFDAQYRAYQQSLKDGDTKGAQELEKELKGKSRTLFDAYEDREKLREQRKKLKQNKKDLEDTRIAIEQRLAETDVDTLKAMLDKFDNKGQKAQIDKAKNEVLKMIQQAMIAKKIAENQGENSNDSNDNITLTDEEQADAKAMQQRMLMNLDRSILKTGAHYDTREAVQSMFGQENDCGAALLEALENYKTCKRGEQYLENKSRYLEFGGEEETFQQKTIKKGTGRVYGMDNFLPENSEHSSETSG